MNWRVSLDGTEVSEPTNLASLVISIIRDDTGHGIGFEVSNDNLSFDGDGAVYIESVKTNKGLKASINVLIEVNCNINSDEFDTVINGVLDLSTYKKTCGNTGCIVSCAIIGNPCEVLLNSRYDQQVNIDSKVAFDGITQLPDYGLMGSNMIIPGKALQLIDSATITEEDTERLNDQPTFPQFSEGGVIYEGHITPASDTQTYAALGSFQPGSFLEYFDGGNENYPSNDDFPITVNTETITGTIKCALSSVVVNFRFKGSIAQTSLLDDFNTTYTYKIYRLPAGLDRDTEANWQTLYSNLLCTLIGTQSADFDIADTITLPKFTQGDFIVISVFMHSSTSSGPNLFPNTVFVQDPVSFYTITANSLCEPSNADVFFVHETLSRITEAITSYCMRAKSSYYGRTDSEPFDFPEGDGCGGLRFLTSGLKLRNAPNSAFNASLKDIIEGLQAIDNVGFGIESDPDKAGFFVLRVEDIPYFYNDVEMLRHDAVPDGEYDIDAAHVYSLFETGYKTWQIQNTNGLDEFNSTREFRTSIEVVSNKLDQTCQLVAGGYPIEITREQSFAASGGADTTYDNNIFIVCVKRVAAYGYYYGGYAVEQGDISEGENVLDPNSVINFRLSPVRNAMKWFKTIAACYPNLSDSDNRMYFNAGTGNYLAEGILNAIYGGCIKEKMSLQENQDILIGDFANIADGTPIWQNETFTYTYPMSLADYLKIKTNPYGYISFQCGNGSWDKGYVKEIDYTPAAGTAKITLKRKWSLN